MEVLGPTAPAAQTASARPRLEDAAASQEGNASVARAAAAEVVAAILLRDLAVPISHAGGQERSVHVDQNASAPRLVGASASLADRARVDQTVSAAARMVLTVATREGPASASLVGSALAAPIVNAAVMMVLIAVARRSHLAVKSNSFTAINYFSESFS